MLMINQVSLFYFIENIFIQTILSQLGPKAKKLKGDGPAGKGANGLKAKGKQAAGSDDDEGEDDDDDDEESVSSF